MQSYNKHDWKTGETISSVNLNNMETGIFNNNAAITKLEQPKAVVTMVASGTSGGATYNEGSATWTFEIPKGEKGEKGETGAQGPQGAAGAKGETGEQGPKGDAGAAGEKGKDGAAGKNGTAMRFFNGNITASSENTVNSKLTPSHADLPLQKGDLVLDTAKKIYQMTAVQPDGSKFTVATAVVSLT